MKIRPKTGHEPTDRALDPVWRRLEALERSDKVSRTRKYSALDLTGVSGGAYSNVTKDADGILTTATANTSVRLPLVVEPGEKITRIQVLVLGTAAGRISVTLKRCSLTLSSATQIGPTVLNTKARPEIVLLDNLAETVRTDMSSYFVELSFNTTSGQKVATIAITSEI